MMTQSLHRPFGRGIIYGAIGGFIGGLVMYAVMSGVMLTIDMGANCFAVIIALITGQQYSNGLVPLGVSVHLITSTVIGAIFGLIISAVNKLRITGFAKGIGFGIATGLIAFAIIFLPIAVTVMPPKMMDLMKAMNSQMMMPESNSKGAMMSGGDGSGSSSSAMMSTNKMSGSDTPSVSGGMTEKSTMTGNSAMNGKSGMMSVSSSNGGMNGQMGMMPDTTKIQSSIIGGSLLGHLVYGAVLGSIVTVLLMKTRKGEEKISR
jgi:hypothetical protein